MPILDIANNYLRAELCVLPAIRDQKRPAVRSWQPYRSRLPIESELADWFDDTDALCLVCGATSGNLEAIDFDLGGEAFPAWCELVKDADPGLIDRLVIEQSPSGGWHVAYRCKSPVSGNLKLAQRKQALESPAEVTICGNRYQPRQDDGGWYVLLTMIETRGEGGLFLCSPTPGYELIQGDFTQLPLLTSEERETLLAAAWELNEHRPEIVDIPTAGVGESRPGDEFNQRGDVRDVLRRHGWTLVRSGANEYWRRPGKTSGWSATLKDNVFYVHSANAAPFDAQTGYSPFSVYALLEHGADNWSAAATELRQQGFGDDGCNIVPPLPTRDPLSDLPDPGPTPDELLRVPGFVSEVMDHTLEIAPYPNQVLAFCGALALQSFLAGRRVRDQADNRTNLYLLGLAYSSVGKDAPRKVNARILNRVGLDHCMGDRFASGEGIQDLMFTIPSMLFQTDEVDGLLQSINRAQDGRHEAIMNTLLRMYSSSNSVFSMRPKAGKEHRGSIDQPSLTIFGTAVPTHYYQALSERMLTNGFFARMIVAESGPRSPGQEPQICEPPSRIVETAKWWSDYRPSTGNLENFHPVPAIVRYSNDATRLLIDARRECEVEYAKSEQRSDPVGTTVWGRVNENSRKLALIYAISQDHQTPEIGKQAAGWGIRFAMHQARRMLRQVQHHVADNPFEAQCLTLLQKLREAEDRSLPHSVALKRMKMDARRFLELVTTLEQRGDIEIIRVRTPGRTGAIYRLLAP